MNILICFARRRLREASTWRGLLLFATLLGVNISPEQKEAIITLGVALVGAVGVFFPDKKDNPPDICPPKTDNIELPESPKDVN